MTSIARQFRPVALRLIKRSTAPSSSIFIAQARSFSASSAVKAKKYTKDHEWVDIDANGKSGTIGISNYAAHSLGDVVYVELPSIGLQIGAGEAIGAVESVKSASDINTPISCTITEVNKTLEETPASINKAPEDTGAGGGWIAKVELGEASVEDFNKLMGEEEYKKFTDEEEANHA